MSETLLHTRIFVPRLRPNFVPRPHLIEELNQGLQSGHKLILVSALVGFGKTTLVSEWGANLRQNGVKEGQIDNKGAWLSLKHVVKKPDKSGFIPCLQSLS